MLSRPHGAPLVVGIVDDVLQRDVALSSNPEVFLAVAQQPPVRAAMLAVKSSAPPAATIAAIQSTLRQIDPSLAATRLESMESVVEASLARFTFVQRLLTLFAGVGLVLAVLGLYAIISYLVIQRTTEIGVRIALGARERHVFEIVVGEAAVLTAIGVIIGLPLTLALTRLLSSFLFNVKPDDVAAIVGSPIVLAFVALGAASMPARRASRVDPAKTLRQD